MTQRRGGKQRCPQRDFPFSLCVPPVSPPRLCVEKGLSVHTLKGGGSLGKQWSTQKRNVQPVFIGARGSTVSFPIANRSRLRRWSAPFCPEVCFAASPQRISRRRSGCLRHLLRSVNSGCSAGFPRLPMYDRSESVERVGRDRAFFGSSATVSIFSGRSAELQRVAAPLLRSPSVHFEFLPLFVVNTLDIHQTSFPSDALSS